MIRILHLRDAASDFQSERSSSALARDAGRDYVSIIRELGRGGELRNLPAAMLGLRNGEYQSDIVHAWSLRTFTAALLSARDRIVLTLSQFPSRRALGWIRAAMDYRDVQLVCPTFTMHRQAVESGIPLERCHLIRPGVEFALVRARRDPALRRALGFVDTDRVILLVGESTRAAAHRLGGWAGSILHRLDPAWKILMWGRGNETELVARFVERLHGPGLVTVAQRKLGRALAMESLLPATDMVLITAADPVSTLPISICMAAALPIVATVTPTVAELLEDRHTAIFAASSSARVLASRMLELSTDSRLQWSLADMARTEAYEYFSLTRFLDQYRTLYRQFASGKPIEIPEPTAGAAQRFHASS